MLFSFSKEEEEFRSEVKAFIEKSLTETLRAGAMASPAVFVEPDIGKIWQKLLADKGWLNYYWPEAYGGQGWSATKKYIFEKEMALADAPAIAVMGLKLLGPILCEFGTEAQKKEYLPKILNGEHYWCQGFSEPGAGSDLASLKMSAVREGDHYVLNGSKIWTTHAHHATHIFCLVRTDSSGPRQEGISFLLVKLDQPGIEIMPIKGLAGDHEVNQIFFDNAKAHIDDLVGEEGQGWEIAKFLLQNERRGTSRASKYLVDIKRVKDVVGYTSAGCHGNLSTDEFFKRELAELELEAKAIEILELRIIDEHAKGTLKPELASVSKLLGSNLRQKIDGAMLKATGYSGLQLETQRPLYGNSSPEPVGDKISQLAAPKYLNSRAWTIFGGTNEIQKTVIARALLSK